MGELSIYAGEQGFGPLFMDPDPDLIRRKLSKKARHKKNKLITEKEAVARYIPDGCYLAVGGFGTNRIPTPVLHEIVRARRKHLTFLGHTQTHDFQILAAGRCFDKVDSSYIMGMEIRGLSPNGRRLLESGEVEMCEWSNYTLAIRLRAASEGVSFGLTRALLGSDTLKRSAAKVITCPFTGKKHAALPALCPDVAVLHVHEADVYGNARINGISIVDMELARASNKVIVVTERIISNKKIKVDSSQTAIPYFNVDAVVHVPFGCYPGAMPYEYFSDEKHIKMWMEAEKDPAIFEKFLKKYIYDVENFNEYLELCGGLERLKQLQQIEALGND